MVCRVQSQTYFLDPVFESEEFGRDPAVGIPFRLSSSTVVGVGCRPKVSIVLKQDYRSGVESTVNLLFYGVVLA